MTEDSIRFPGPRPVVEDGAHETAASLPLLLGLVRRLRARERSHLAGLLHDGPIQELAAAPLCLAEARRASGSAQQAELSGVARQVDAASRSMRDVQDELQPFPRASSGLAALLRQRTGWLLDRPLSVDAGAGAAGLPEAEIQLVADIIELIVAGLLGQQEPVPSQALAAVQADSDLIFLELNMTFLSDGDLAPGDMKTATASLRSLAAVAQGGADLAVHGRHLRIRMEIPR